MLTDQTNFSSVMHVSFFTGQNIEKLILKNCPIKPKISPHMHKYVFLKSIKVLIAKSIT